MMRKWLVAMSLAVFLLTGISTSSFSLVNFLTIAIESDRHTAAQLNFATTHDNKAALYHAWKKSEQGSENWQILAKKLAQTNGEIAYLLADFYLTDFHRVKEYTNKKNAPQSAQAILWFQQAIRLNYPQASIALAQWYFHQGDLLEAQKLLANLKAMRPPLYEGEINLAAIILQIKIAISIGDTRLTKTLLNKFSSLLRVKKTGKSLLNAIEKYQVLPLRNDITNTNNKTSPTCSNSIQIFATNIAHLKQAEQLIKHFKLQPLNGFVCFSPVRYIAIADLSCSSELLSAILCDESKLSQVANTVSTRYIGFMLPEGGANVHLGMLYFDAQDSIDVLEHEVSHLLGFVDEYPLIKGHEKCFARQQQKSAQNIAVLKKYYYGERKAIRAKILMQLAWAKQIAQSTPILQFIEKNASNDKQWLLGTPEQFENEVGVFISSTCEKNDNGRQSNFTAYKPLSRRTKLEYNALEFPTEYMKVLNKNSQQFIMPSFHYNIALSYFQQNNIEQANYWLKQAARWENDDIRRGKILQGGF